MNSDSLDQLWQQQPVPPVQVYRDIRERSWALRQRVNRLDALGAAVIVGPAILLIGLIGVMNREADWLHWVWLIGGLVWLGWAGRASWQRRRLRQSRGECLLREVDLELLRLRQNLTLIRRLSWIVPPLMVAVGVWVFWPQEHAYRATTVNDWIWSGSFMVGWATFAGWSLWSARKRRRELNELCVSLTELRASLLALGNSDAAD